ncbi:11568_t:CDS:2 [Funneliformis mosseae]|uniref:11568_t:CDS:1 n=1 Tax=Funneliformis mosseae TaxID=27381 RepID=A0A9N9DQ86_FUNMO|nr:11568_t:CDS:2 [Funneliformis mosseae]
MLVVTFLNLYFKIFDWYNGNSKNEVKELVQELYDNAKKNLLPKHSINSIISSSDDDDDIFKVLRD